MSQNKTIQTPKHWDYIWMSIATIIAQKSKDPETKVGAVVASPDNKQCTLGFNGFPVKVKDYTERWKRPEKYLYVCHAESNAIDNRKSDLTNWTLYVTLFPCLECTKRIIQSGIKRVVYLETHKDHQTWSNISLSKKLLQEARIKTCKFKD